MVGGRYGRLVMAATGGRGVIGRLVMTAGTIAQGHVNRYYGRRPG